MKAEFLNEFAQFIGPKRLNIGCGASPEPGWVNVDFNPQVEGVLRVDLRYRPWPFERGSLDTVLASHFLEHFRDDDLFNILAEAGDVLRVGGHLIGIVPYATHSSAYANPFHKSLWDMGTPPQFSSRLYEQKDTASEGAHQFMPLVNWTVVHMGLSPDPDWVNKTRDEISEALKSQLNVIKEMQFVLRKES